MNNARPLASLSLDLDNKWSYMKTHGDVGWESFPTYLPLVVPRVLSILSRLNLSITFFIVGQDAAKAENHQSLRAIAEAGHEIGNHSFKHEPWLHLYSEDELEKELAQTEDALESATGHRPIGFRGPGFSLSPTVLRVLHRRGYLYDCSTFPTFLGPLARLYYFFTAKLSKEEREERKKLFGTFSEGFRPLKPYCWEMAEGRMIEIPVTTMPGFRVPIHVSYLLYLSRFHSGIALAYFSAAMRLCRWTGTAPSLLLHPLDFLGGDDCPDLAFFPAMDLSGQQKCDFVERALQLYGRWFEVVPMREHRERLLNQRLPIVEADSGRQPSRRAIVHS